MCSGERMWAWNINIIFITLIKCIYNDFSMVIFIHVGMGSTMKNAFYCVKDVLYQNLFFVQYFIFTRCIFCCSATHIIYILWSLFKNIFQFFFTASAPLSQFLMIPPRSTLKIGRASFILHKRKKS